MKAAHELKPRDVTRFLQEHGQEDEDSVEILRRQHGTCLIDARGKNEPHCVDCDHLFDGETPKRQRRYGWLRRMMIRIWGRR
jgi:hypothetical protein